VPLGLRWIDDAFLVAPRAGAFLSCLADMTNAKAAVRLMRESRIPATMGHVIVRACALALARHPELHRMACNYRHLAPASVDIGLSMAGQTSYAPVVVLPAADAKPLRDLIPFIIDAIDAAIEKEAVDLRNMRRQLWLIPFGFLRRFFLRLMNGSLWFRRRLVGTFQVSIVPAGDLAVPLLFYTGAILAIGAVRDRVIAVDGQPVVRQTAWLTVSIDHAALDGVRTGQLIEAIKGVLEGDDLLREARDACEARRSARAATGTEGTGA
jgi:pyruvate/2-oxoglutarate dehydrogenase complex dihydrolipoamide acyltransferase (E2) component